MWLIKTYGVSLPFALHVVFVSDPQIKKQESEQTND